jgi:four helix bundle protein
MKNPEVIMPEALSSPSFIVHRKAIEAAGLTLALASPVRSPLRSLSDQTIRAASSVPANVSEGHGRFGKDRRYHWSIAYGSAKEVETHLLVLVGAGAVDATQAQEALQLFDEVRAMLWRLLHPTS